MCLIRMGYQTALPGHDYSYYSVDFFFYCYYYFICLKGQGGLYGFTCWLLRIVFVWNDTLVEGAKANHDEADEGRTVCTYRWMDAPQRAGGLDYTYIPAARLVGCRSKRLTSDNIYKYQNSR